MAIHSDILPFVIQLVEHRFIHSFKVDANSAWWQMLKPKCDSTNLAVRFAESNIDGPLNYYSVFRYVREMIPKDSIIVCEGWNTMKIGASMLPNDLPRHRLDAGSFGAMGVSVLGCEA